MAAKYDTSVHMQGTPYKEKNLLSNFSLAEFSVDIIGTTVGSIILQL